MMEKIFEGQREDEKVEMIFRKHFTVWLPIIFLPLILIYGVLASIYFNLSTYVLYTTIIIFSFSMLFFFYKLILWYYSYFILTNQRLRCIQRNGIFAKAIVDISLKSITNTQYQESGFVGSMIYKYGNINIESVSADLFIERVADANSVYNALQDLLEKDDDD